MWRREAGIVRRWPARSQRCSPCNVVAATHAIDRRHTCRKGAVSSRRRREYIRGLRVTQPTIPLSAADRSTGRDDGSDPGVVVVFSGGAAAARIMPLEAGRIELGRTDGSPGQLDDGRVSRSHALVERDGERWMVTDLGSQNGTFVDGERILPRAPTPVARVVRVGDTLVV